MFLELPCPETRRTVKDRYSDDNTKNFFHREESFFLCDFSFRFFSDPSTLSTARKKKKNKTQKNERTAKKNEY